MNTSAREKYKDIIDLPHPVSKKHPQMSIHDRAAQFAPFAALTGHEESINDTAREHEEAIFEMERNEIFYESE